MDKDVNESDPRSNVHYLGSSANKAWKKIHACMGFEKFFLFCFFLKLHYLVTIDMKLTSQNVKADNILIVCTVCSAHSHCASRLFYISY